MLRRIVLAVLLAVFAVFPAAIQAQDAEPIVCDSTLITLLYIAEHDYSFHSMMDVSQFDKGQLAPLFDAMMAAMEEEGEMMDESMMTEEAMMEEGEMMDESMMMLAPGNVAGENPACTELRAEVEAFLYAELGAEMMMDEGM